MAVEIINTHAFSGSSDAFNVPRYDKSLFENPLVTEKGTMGHIVIAFDARENERVIAEVAKTTVFLGSWLMANPNPDPGIKIPRTKADLPREIERLLDEPHVVGIKTHPPMFQTRIDDPLYDPYYELAQRKGVPIMPHFSSKAQEFTSATMLENVLHRFPNLLVLAAHAGGLTAQFIEEMIALAEENPNVWLNTTGLHKAGNPARVDRDTLTRATVLSKNKEEELAKIGKLFVHAATVVIPDQFVPGDDRVFHTLEELLEGFGYRWPINLLDTTDRKRIDYTNPKRLFGSRLKQAV